MNYLSAIIKFCSLKNSNKKDKVIFMIKYLILLSLSLNLCGDELKNDSHTPLSFFNASTFKEYDNKLVQIKGFLYKLPNDELILSEEPGLKSCCVDKKNKIKIYIHGLDNISSAKKALTLQGRLIIFNESDYFLEDAVISQEIKNPKLAFFMLFSAISALLLFFLRLFYKGKLQVWDCQKFVRPK